MSQARLTGRVALVTGASRGLGAAVAEQLAAEGAHVVLVARTVGGLEALDDRIRAAGGSATLIPQDLADHAKLDVLGPALHDRFGRLDILVAAAADAGRHGPVAHADPKAWERTFAVGVTANMRLIRTLHPLLALSDAGRAVFVTDRVGCAPTAYWNAYGAAKAALDAMVITYAAENTQGRLRINLVDPGPMATALREKIFPGEPPGTQADPAALAGAIVDLTTPDCARHGDRIILQGA